MQRAITFEHAKHWNFEYIAYIQLNFLPFYNPVQVLYFVFAQHTVTK